MGRRLSLTLRSVCRFTYNPYHFQKDLEYALEQSLSYVRVDVVSGKATYTWHEYGKDKATLDDDVIGRIYKDRTVFRRDSVVLVDYDMLQPKDADSLVFYSYAIKRGGRFLFGCTMKDGEPTTFAGMLTRMGWSADSFLTLFLRSAEVAFNFPVRGDVEENGNPREYSRDKEVMASFILGDYAFYGKAHPADTVGVLDRFADLVCGFAYVSDMQKDAIVYKINKLLREGKGADAPLPYAGQQPDVPGRHFVVMGTEVYDVLYKTLAADQLEEVTKKMMVYNLKREKYACEILGGESRCNSMRVDANLVEIKDLFARNGNGVE